MRHRIISTLARIIYILSGEEQGRDLRNWLIAEKVINLPNRVKIFLSKNLGTILILLGTLFAAYDMFPSWNMWNTRHFPICSGWNTLIQEIYPHTSGSIEKIENVKSAVFKIRDNKFDKLFKIIQLNTNRMPIQKPSQILISSEERVQQGDYAMDVNSGVYVGNDRDEWIVICSAEILTQWIRNFRQTWFLKWGLIIVALGSFISLKLEI